MDFPITKTKVPGLTKKFDLNDPLDRHRYFEAKCGEELDKLRDYFKKDAFIAYLLAKKSAGKGTYSRLLVDIFGEKAMAHLSVGDIVRAVDEEVRDSKKRKKLENYLERKYRGYYSLAEIIRSQKSRSTQKLLPTEYILALLEREISRMPKKALLIDGLPRDMDQISYSLFYRALVGYREDPDFFVLIQIPEAVIDARMKTRVVCPKCHNPRSLKLLPTKYVGYLPRKKEFYLMCDNKKCQKAVMEPKEGDHLGIKHIKKRLDRDQALMEQALKLHGIPKILLRNAVPVTKAKRYVDDYELTPMYSYQWDPGMKRVITNEEPWIVKDDQGVPSYSLLAPAVVVTFIKQMVQVLGL